jgi:hypothetical protein
MCVGIQVGAAAQCRGKVPGPGALGALQELPDRVPEAAIPLCPAPAIVGESTNLMSQTTTSKAQRLVTLLIATLEAAIHAARRRCH